MRVILKSTLPCSSLRLPPPCKQNLLQNFITKIFKDHMGCGTSQSSIENCCIPGKDLYQRKQMIGVGNHGRVYRSIHQVNNKQVAIKVIDRFKDLNPSFPVKDRLELIDRLKKLRGERITPYYEIQVNELELSIVMDLAEEATLKKFVQKNGKLGQEKVANIVEQVLEGLLYLHGASVLHKDLKSSNILMFKDQSVKLSDYALAEIYDKRLSAKAKGSKPGNADFSRGESLPYMAPEVIKDQGISEKSDVWSVGCVVIQMLTGKVPWIDINPKFQKAFKEITSQLFPPLPSCSVQCKDFLSRCLAISPLKRASVSDLLKHSFIRSYSKKPYHEEVDKVKLSLQKNDTANRISSRNSNKKQANEQPFKTPTSIEKTIKNENNVQSSYHSRQKVGKYINEQKNMNQSSGSLEQLKKLKEAVNNFGKIKKSRDVKAIHNDDILPEIMEDQEPTVMLNNKKIKMKNPSKFKTEQTDTTDQREYRNSIRLQDNSSYASVNSNDRYRVKSKKNGHLNDSFQRQYSDSKVKLQTQPILVTTQFQKDHEYFKKPLKLLKKKLRERKMKYITNQSSTLDQEQSVAKQQQSEQEYRQSNEPDIKIRTISQKRRQEMAINTQLAKAERDRYINQQLLMKKQKEKQKQKWQEQLLKQSQIIKKQFSHRYAYQRYHPVII